MATRYVTDAEWRYVARALGWSGYGIAAAWCHTEFEPDELEEALDRYLPWQIAILLDGLHADSGLIDAPSDQASQLLKTSSNVKPIPVLE